MTKMRAWLWTTMMVLSLFAFGNALADAGGAVAANPWAPYFPLVAAALGAIGATVRGYTPQSGFWHQWYGHALLMLIGAIAGSLWPIFQSGHVSKAAMISAAVGGVSTFLGAWKTTGKADVNTLPVILPLAFMLALSAGCPSAGGQAFGKCELGQLVAQDQTVAVDVTAIAVAGGANWQNQLESLGASLAPGQLSCVVQAIAAAWAASHGDLAPERAAALQRLNQYLAAHPAHACVAVPRA